ncbi:hypothetical protein Q8A67_001355 [Cirrhinus molitorella]|uniref:Uncharacterized protein n=1 Tax=Cirrhinus molitorella TaxID=172907 RepID=A0AA88Q9M8_9TELE|nr:hypothetical protein Q8A67_001355 [Cirrhinus molitorella]
MDRIACDPGMKWDSLLKRCFSLEYLGLISSTVPPPMLKSVLSTRGPDESWSTISPSVWICVSLVATGSVLVLLLWFIIYRRHSRTSQNTDEKDSTAHTPTAIEQEEENLSPWLQVNGQTQEVPINEGPCGRSLCNGRADHGLPLPATELGDSALVTAKTGQPV